MKRSQWMSVGAAAAAFAALPLAGAAAQQPVAQFYKDRTVTIVVAAGAGGPFGLRANLLSQFLGKHIPGNPTVVAQYMPGAGGRKAANYLYNAAPKDGTAFGILFYNTALGYRLQPKGASFDPLKFHWLGSQNSISPILFVWHSAPATSIDAMQKTPLVFGATGTTSPTGIFPNVLNYIAGTKIRVVKGYPSVPSYIKAAESGEIHGAMSGWDALVTNYSDRLKSKEIVPIAQISPIPHPDLKEVPLLPELATSEELRKIAEFFCASSLIGHTNVAPPGVPAERLAALQAAIIATYKDSGAIAAGEKTGTPVEPVSAADVRRAVEQVMNAPDDLVARARQAAGFQ